MQISLYIGSSFSSAWQQVLLPWFESAGAAAFTQREPVAVLTPFATDAAFLRSKLLELGISLLGVKFLTPAQLREVVVQNGASIPLRERENVGGLLLPPVLTVKSLDRFITCEDDR